MIIIQEIKDHAHSFFLNGKIKIFTFLHTIHTFQQPRRTDYVIFTCEQMARLENKLLLIKVELSDLDRYQ